MHDERLRSLTDDDLLGRLSKLLESSRRLEADLVAHIGEVDRRRLYAREACASMFVYCTQVLHLSEHEAYTRITIARAARKHPVLLDMLRDGRLHLSGAARLVPHLTKENRDAVLGRAAHKTKRRIEELIAELAPRPDVPSTIRKLPERPPKAAPTRAQRCQLVPERVTNLPISPTEPEPRRPAPPRPSAQRPEPLSPARYRIQFTASAGLKEKLERLQALMRPAGGDADLAAVIEQAVTEKLERLEAKRFAATKAPRKSLEKTDTAARTRAIPAAVKRAVRARDGNRCTYRSSTGRRCSERRWLEYHHHEPYGRGGDHAVENVSLRCRAHNLLQAELDYGTRAMESFRKLPDGAREPAPGYGCDRASPNRVRMYSVALSGGSLTVPGPLRT